jgi:hypothetical protein
MEHYYILFENHTDGIAMYEAVKEAGISARISPTPRQLSVCCGIALLVEEEDVPSIKALAEQKSLAYMKIEGLNNTFDNQRHKYG